MKTQARIVNAGSGLGGVAVANLLSSLLDGARITVEVCALYLPNSGRQASDLLPGVTPAKPAEVAAHLLRPGVQTLAF